MEMENGSQQLSGENPHTHPHQTKKSSPLGTELQEYLAQCVVYSISGIGPKACQQYEAKIDFP